MARMITEKVVGAFNKGLPCLWDNSESTGDSLKLFGNQIAFRTHTGAVHVTTAGWNTRTTRNRLNEITGCRVEMRRGKLFINNHSWDGGWVCLCDCPQY